MIFYHMITLSWPRLAQKVQADYKLIMVLGRSIYRIELYARLCRALGLLYCYSHLQPSVHSRCVALPPALKTFRFTPQPPAPPACPLRPRPCIIVALSSPPSSKSMDGCLCNPAGSRAHFSAFSQRFQMVAADRFSPGFDKRHDSSALLLCLSRSGIVPLQSLTLLLSPLVLEISAMLSCILISHLCCQVGAPLSLLLLLPSAAHGCHMWWKSSVAQLTASVAAPGVVMSWPSDGISGSGARRAGHTA